MGELDSGAGDVDDYSPPVRIEVLRPLTATIGGDQIPLAGRLQARLITALAAAATNRTGVSIADLVDEVYGTDLPPKPRRALATLVWRIRRMLGAEAIVGDGTSYRMDPDLCTIDAIEFEERLQHARAVMRTGAEAAAAAALRDGLALWSDTPAIELLPDQPVTIRLRELRIGATEHLAHALAQCGDNAEAIELLETVVTTFPEREHSHAQLIDCHLATRDLVSARRVHDRARRYLAEQGIEPGAALQDSALKLNRIGTIPAPRPAPPDEPLAQSPSAGVPAVELGSAVVSERRADLRRVVSAAAAALSGHRSIGVLIDGEPGIGKSTMADAVLSQIAAAVAQPRVITLHGDPRRTLPYAPLGGLLALAAEFPGKHEPLAGLLLGQSGDLAGGQPHAAPLTDRERIHAAVEALVRTACRPTGLVLVMEDLHWVSPETADVLTEILARGADLPLTVIATTRDRSEHVEFARSCRVHLRLQGLSAPAIAELIGSAGGSDPERGGGASRARSERLLRLTGGNPLYLLQLQGAGALEAKTLPAGLEVAITAHLEATNPDIVETLGLAAVVGLRFDIGVLAAMSGTLRIPRPILIDRLNAGEELGLLRRDREQLGQYAFVHGLIRDRLYQGLSAQLRTQAHADIGRAMDRLALARPFPADLLAYHYVRGWPEVTTGEVIDKLGIAADAAIAQLDFRQAADHHRQALDHLAMDPEAGDPAKIAETLGKAAHSAAAAGDVEAATALYNSQSSLAARAELPAVRIAAALGLLRTHHGQGTRIPAADQLADALSDVGGTQQLSTVPELAGEALGALQVQRPHRAEQLLDELIAAEPSMAAVLRGAIWEHRSVPDQVIVARQLMADPAAEPVGAWLRLWVAEVAAGMRAFDDPPSSNGQVRYADDRTQFEFTLWRITTTIAAGRLTRAEALIDRALAAPRPADAAETARRIANLHAQRLFLSLWSKDVRVDPVAPLTVSPNWVTRHPIVRYLSAYLAAYRGEQSAARESCDDLLDELADEAFPDSALLVRLGLLADACRLAGYRAGMETCLQHLLPHSGFQAFFHFAQHFGAVDRVIGKLQVGLGDLDAGITSLTRAGQQYQAVRAQLHLWQSHQDLAAMLNRRGRTGDRAEAQRHQEQAHLLGLEIEMPGQSATSEPVGIAGRDQDRELAG